MKHVSAICLILAALMLCACAPAVPVQPVETVTPVPTVTPTAEPAAKPTAEQSFDDEWMDKWLEVCRDIYADPCGWGCAITPYNKNEIFPQASGVFKNMLPVLDTAIKATAVTQYQKPVQG